MFSNDRYNWETDDELGKKLSGEVASIINEALNKLSEIANKYHDQIRANQSRLSSIEGEIISLCNDTARYID